jgi:hypothetical protein
MRWAMNDSMASIFRGIGPAFPLEMLPPELGSLARAGVLRSEGRVHLAMSQVKTAPPEDFDDCSAERWSNTVHLESQLPPSDPACLYCVRTSADDSSSSVDQLDQPVLVVTVQ